MRHAFTALFLLAGGVGCSAAADPAVGVESSSLGGAVCGLDPNASHTLAQLMGPAITGAHEADHRFQCLEKILRARKDRRAPFATLYSMTTTNVNLAVAAGHFGDGVWVSKYLTAFAELYRVAFYDFEIGNGSAAPDAWRIAFHTAAGKKELIVQDLALGVNAHVDRDLAYALVQVGIGTTPDERSLRYRDHTAVNDVLHAEINAALAKIAVLYAPGYKLAPAEVMQILETTFFGALVAGRQNAWDNAVALDTAPPGFARAIVDAWIEAGASTIADAILTPQIDPALVAVLRQLEGS